MAIKVGALTPEQRDATLAVVKEYLITSGLLRRLDGIQVFAQPENLYVRNMDSQEAPPFACMQVSGTETYDNATVIRAARPVDTTGSAGLYLFNSRVAIAPGAVGLVFAGPVVRVLVDASSIVCGDSWGPVVGQWYVTDEGNVLSAIGSDVIEDDVMRAFVKSAGTSCSLPVTDLRIDGFNFQLSRDCEATWETWAVGDDCPPP
jgi:hypothetical protein